MKVAIAGAKGMLGSEFARHLSIDHEVLALSHIDLDVSDDAEVRRIILSELPALIINCAVLSVDGCEADPELARRVNVAGAGNLAKAAAAVDAELVHFSSNYVFDGQRQPGSFYTIDDEPNPASIYGQTKLAGERAVTNNHLRSFVVRTSWVFGPGKESFFSTAVRSLRNMKTIRAISDVYGSATYLGDLVERVLQIVALHHHGTYHVVNSGICSFAQFAFEVARVLGISDDQARDLIQTAELRNFDFAAPRPFYTPMFCKTSAEIGLGPLRDWRKALSEYVDRQPQTPSA